MSAPDTSKPPPNRRQRLAERCLKQPIRREKIFGAMFLMLTEGSISLHAPEMVVTMLMTFAVFGHDVVGVWFDEEPDFLSRDAAERLVRELTADLRRGE